MRHLLGGEREPRRVQLSTEPGLFAPDSVTRRVHADTSMLVGGLRSLFFQTVHPLAMAGVAQHSDYRQQPWGRLRRTAAFVGITTFGTEAEAEVAIERVRRVHERVTGTSPAGVPYRASDPHLLAWVHATEVDSFARAYDRFGRGRFDAADHDGYVAEMAVVGERLGVVDAPRNWDDLQAYLVAIRPELRATSEAHQAVRFLLTPPVPLAAVPPYAAVAGAAIGLLPSDIRRKLWLPVPPLLEPLVVRPATAAVLGVLGWALEPQATAA